MLFVSITSFLYSRDFYFNGSSWISPHRFALFKKRTNRKNRAKNNRYS